jgi:adenosylhomocysteine nucleosidase
MNTLVCFALKEEAAPFHKIAAGKPGVATLTVGIGRKNAETALRKFLSGTSPKMVLCCGFAGGLNPKFKLGDVVFEIGNLNPEIGNRLVIAGAKRAVFHCANSVATTAAEKKKLFDKTGADAVEMESAGIRAVCSERGILVGIIRVISDTANEDLPLDFNVLANPDKSLNFGKLAMAMAKSPWKIGALMKLQKNTNFAANQLAAVLDKIIAS